MINPRDKNIIFYFTYRSVKQYQPQNSPKTKDIDNNIRVHMFIVYVYIGSETTQ